MQFQIESGTRKVDEILNDIGLTQLRSIDCDGFSSDRVIEFIQQPQPLDEAHVEAALETARLKTCRGLDGLKQWLDTL